MAALLGGLLTAGAGCQMNGFQQDAFAIRCPGGGGTSLAAITEAPIASAGIASTAQRRPLFTTGWRTHREPALAPGSSYDGPAATMLRPIPAGTGPSEGTVISSYQPVQRISADSGPSQLRPVAGGTTEPTVLPLPIASGDLGAGKAEGLPFPRQLDNNQKQPPPIGPRRNGALVPSNVKDAFPAPGMQLVEAPREFRKKALSAYIIEPPDILRIEVVPGILPKSLQQVSGPHLVRPDGTVGLGIYGDVFVAGMTLEQARWAVAQKVLERIRDKDIRVERIVENTRVDVSVFNSKFYYVITDGAGYGEQVVRVPCTGNETVLDAVAAIQGLPPQSTKKKVWVARATPDDHNGPHILPVDWCGIAQRGSAATNYQVFPGDRIYVHSDKWLTIGSWVEKRLSVVDRIMGSILLGSSTVNSIKSGSNTGTTR
jgi:protein involved in polysaccharide export with SLBB domain